MSFTLIPKVHMATFYDLIGNRVTIPIEDVLDVRRERVQNYCHRGIRSRWTTVIHIKNGDAHNALEQPVAHPVDVVKSYIKYLAMRHEVQIRLKL